MENPQKTPQAQKQFLLKLRALPPEKRVECFDCMIHVLMTANNIKDKNDMAELSTDMTRFRLMHLSESLNSTALYDEFCRIIGAKGWQMVGMEGLEAVDSGKAMPLAHFMHFIDEELKIAQNELSQKEITQNSSFFTRIYRKIFKEKPSL